MLGLVSTEPSEKRSVGTTRSPSLTVMTHWDADSSSSSPTSSKGMPRSLSRCLSRRQGPHVVVVNMVNAASGAVLSVTGVRMPQ